MLISTLRLKIKASRSRPQDLGLTDLGLSWRRFRSPPRCNGFCPRLRCKSTAGQSTPRSPWCLRPALRRHVAVYVNGQPVHDRVWLTDPVGPHDEIYVFQALSGG